MRKEDVACSSSSAAPLEVEEIVEVPPDPTRFPLLTMPFLEQKSLLETMTPETLFALAELSPEMKSAVRDCNLSAVFDVQFAQRYSTVDVTTEKGGTARFALDGMEISVENYDFFGELSCVIETNFDIYRHGKIRNMRILMENHQERSEVTEMANELRTRWPIDHLHIADTLREGTFLDLNCFVWKHFLTQLYVKKSIHFSLKHERGAFDVFSMSKVPEIRIDHGHQITEYKPIMSSRTESVVINGAAWGNDVFNELITIWRRGNIRKKFILIESWRETDEMIALGELLNGLDVTATEIPWWDDERQTMTAIDGWRVKNEKGDATALFARTDMYFWFQVELD